MNTPYYCPFAKALLSAHSRCRHAQSFHIAERHGIQCQGPESAQQRCDQLAKLIHEQSRFALGVTHLPTQMTSNMELRIQCGGINGIINCLQPPGLEPPVDIDILLTQAIDQFGNLEQIPFSRVAQSITQWQPRRRARNRERE